MCVSQTNLNPFVKSEIFHIKKALMRGSGVDLCLWCKFYNMNGWCLKWDEMLNPQSADDMACCMAFEEVDDGT
jgi:hypothetical protein